MKAGYLAAAPTLAELWERAGYGGPESRGGLTQEASRVTAGPLWSNPGVHVSEEQDQFCAIDKVMDDPYCLGDPGEPEGDTCYHLIQDEAVISDLQQNVLPPDEYYEELAGLWKKWWPKCDPALLIHMMSVLIAFDTATAFAMSFSISKFALAQEEAKLV